MPTPIVLAGGRSTRFGRDKLREPIGGDRWLVDRAIDALREATGAPVTLVGACAPEVAARGDRAIEDVVAGLGPAGGVASAFRHFATDLVVLSGDLPRIDATAVRALITRWRDTPSALVVRAVGRSPEPCVAVYRAAIAPRLEQRLREGRRSLFDLAEPHELVEVAIADDVLGNANTSDALRDALGGASPAGVWAFEAIDESLDLVPIAARRALDRAGVHLSLEGWRSLALDDRRALVGAGCDEIVDPNAVRAIAEHALLAPRSIDAAPELDPTRLPDALAAALGSERDAVIARWPSLRPVERFAIAHAARSAARRGDPGRLLQIVSAVLAGARDG